MAPRKKINKPTSLKFEPLQGQFFDIKPSKSGPKAPVLGWVRDYTRFALIAFLAFVFLNVGNAYVKGKHVASQTSNLAYAGYEDLQQGMDFLLKQDGQKASDAFKQAEETFTLLQKTTQPFTSTLQVGTVENPYLNTADTLVNVALQVSDMGGKLAQFADSFKALAQGLPGQEVDWLVLIHQKKEELHEILVLATEVQQKITTLDKGVLPDTLQQKLSDAEKQMGTFLALLTDLNQTSNQLLTLMGDRVPHRYLVLLQNNHELRATGGFIGSYLIVDVNDGKITKMEARDVYDSDGQLSKVLPAPPGIDRVAKQWFMRDANYSPDFPTSARELMWFLEASRGPSVDTVVAVDQSFVKGLLGLLGEFQLEGFAEPINEGNFSRVMSFYTEAKLSQTNTPKQLLFDLIPRFKDKLTHFEDWPAVLALAQSMIKQGHFQVYSREESLQALFENYGLAGEVIPPQKKTDYLNVVSTSIGGNKTDAFIKTTLSHNTVVEGNGGLMDELVIQKQHTFGAAERGMIEALVDQYGAGELTKETLVTILGGGKNLDYMRVYVPLGSKIKSAIGVNIEDVEVSEDLGYTVFGFVYGPVAPGDRKDVKITYELPFDLRLRLVDNYRFVAQKQAGVENITLDKTIDLPEFMRVVKAYPEIPESDETVEEMPQITGPLDGAKLFLTAISSE